METKRTEKRKVEREVVIEHEIHCDGCKRRASNPRGGLSTESRGPDWASGNFDFDVTLLRRVIGENYPEMGSSETFDYHLCPNCWNEIVVAALDARGIKPQVTKADW